MAEVGLTYGDIGKLSIGDAISVLSHHRAVKADEQMATEERVRLLAYFSSSMLDHKGKTLKQLYQLPWEYEKHKKLDKDTALMHWLKFNRANKEQSHGIKEESVGDAGSGRQTVSEQTQEGNN